MASVPVTLDGALYDLWSKTTQRVVFIGQASLTGLGVGGGPIIPDQPPGQPPGGGGPPGVPTFPIWGPPGIDLPPGPGYPPVAGHPIVPPINVPPGVTLPDPPPPGSPPVILPGTKPTHPIVPPPFVVVDYPGIGKVMVPQPTETTGS
jgi:hypothetical protein